MTWLIIFYLINTATTRLNLINSAAHAQTNNDYATSLRTANYAIDGYISYCNGGSCYDNSDYNVFQSSGQKMARGANEDISITLDATYTIKTLYIAWADSFMASDDSSHNLIIDINQQFCYQYENYDHWSVWVECITPITGNVIRIRDPSVMYISEVLAFEQEAVQWNYNKV